MTAPRLDARPDDPPALATALRLLERGLWPIPIHAPGTRIGTLKNGSPKVSKGKEPIGDAWGLTRHTAETLRAVYGANPGANLGILLGRQGTVIDVEVEDRTTGGATLLDLLGGEMVTTLGWDSERGGHLIFRFTERLSRYKAIVKGDWLPGVEIRIGALGSGGQQYQSVCPPSKSAAGIPRTWNGHREIAELPDAFFEYLDRNMPKPGPKVTRPRILKFTGPRPVGSWDADEVKEALRDRYGELAAEWGLRLTGRTFDGSWAECHAFDREDRSPSAGLNLASGVYHDFGSDTPGLSFFHLGVALGAFPDFSTAVNALGQRFGVRREDVYIGIRPEPQPAREREPGEDDDKDEPWAGNGDVPPEADPMEGDATAADLIRVNAKIRWTWEGWIPIGVLTILASEPGIGKTRLCADLLRRVYLGLCWPDGKPATYPAGSVGLWVPADNQHAELGTFPDFFGFPPEALYLNATRSNPFVGTMLDTAEDLKDFEDRIVRLRPVFVFIDTSLNATDRTAHRPEDAKAFFKPLQEIAARTQTSILCVTHLNAGGKPLGRRITGQGRVVIQMETPDPEGQPLRRKLHVTKSHSLFPPPLGVTMGTNGNEYDSTPPVPPPSEDGGDVGLTAKVRECIIWLRDRLDDKGSDKVSDIRNAAEKAGFSAKILYKAKDRLPINEFELESRKWWQLTTDDTGD